MKDVDGTTIDGPWMLDASNANFDTGVFAFCPFQDEQLVYGMTYVSDMPPGPIVGVFHPEGQQQCEDWVIEHSQELQDLMNTANARFN